VKSFGLGAAVLVACVSAAHADAQVLTYQTGQDISPAYEGWEQNADGSFNLVFGYMNRNWGEDLDIPVGEDNYFSPGPEDRGQPTHFYPRRNRFTFKVRVPADFGSQELVWTLRIRGSEEKAFASLRPDYKLDAVVVMSETGALGIGVSDSIMRANTAPSVELVGEPVRRVGVGQPVTLVARVTDDGIPRIPRRPPPRTREGPPRLPPAALRPPPRITVDKELGLHLAWFVYRGDGELVTFDPPQVKTWEDTRAGANSPWAPLWESPPVPENGEYTVRVSFDRPGTYVLRGRADDGGLFSDTEVTIIVAPVSQ
jgi:hypothetical protein